MNDIETLIEKSVAFDNDKADWKTYAREVEFDAQAHLIAKSNFGAVSSQPLTVTSGALGQILSKLGPTVFGKGSAATLPRLYFEAIIAKYPELAGHDLTQFCQKGNGNRWLVRQYQNTCRAVVDGEYPGGMRDGRFENTLYLESLNERADANIAQLPNFHVYQPTITPDKIIVKTIWKNDDRGGGYGVGACVTNDETGHGYAQVYGLIKRFSCDNSTVIDLDNLANTKIVHRGSYAAIVGAMKSAIGQVIGCDFEFIEKVWEAETERIPEIGDVIRGLALKNGWANEVTQSVFSGTERAETRMGLVNGVTWAAHMAVKDPFEQFDMERLGGKILLAPESLFGKAAESYRTARNHADSESDELVFANLESMRL